MFLRIQYFIDLGKIDAEKFVGSGIHVAIVMLSLRTFFIQKLVNSIISRLILNQGKHDCKQSSPQYGAPFLVIGLDFDLC